MNFEVTPTPDPFLFESFVKGIIEMEGIEATVVKSLNEDGDITFQITFSIFPDDKTYAESYLLLQVIHRSLKGAADSSGGLSIRPERLFSDHQLKPEIAEALEQFGNIEITPLSMDLFGKTKIFYDMKLRFTCSFLSDNGATNYT